MGKKTRIGSNSASSELIKSVISRLEKLSEEKQAIADDIKEVFAEAKGNGLDAKVLRGIIKLRNEDAAARAEYNSLLGLYCEAMGMPDPFS